MDHHAAPARLIAIPIVAVGLLLGAGRAGAYQEGTPVVPVEPPTPPAVVETPESEPIVETPDPADATEPPAEPDATVVPGGRAGGEPPAEDASITAAVDPQPPTEEPPVDAAAAPQPPTDRGEAPQPLPRGKINPRRIEIATNAPAPAPTAGPVPAPAPAPAPAPVASIASTDVAVMVPAAPAVGGGLLEAAGMDTIERRGAARAAPRPEAVALPSTGAGASVHGVRPDVVALAWAAVLLALGVASDRRRHGA